MRRRNGNAADRRADPDRFLTLRAGNYAYKRRVPRAVEHLDSRAPHVRASLKTRDLALARAKRDQLEAADDALWASLAGGGESDPAMARYRAAMRRVEALGFSWRSAQSLAASASLDDIASRLRLIEPNLPRHTAHALAGGVETPAVTVSAAFDIYCDEIVADELVGKSAVQKAQWRKVKQRAVSNFVALIGDKAMADITRDDAHRLYRHWLERIAPKNGAPTHSASSGNRDIGNMRVLHDAFFAHMGEARQNPFEGLSFAARRKRSRPPFPRDWLVTRILAPGALAGMNEEARGIVLTLVETGARPSEIANLEPSAIRLSHKVPHLAIEPRADPDDPREIKTQSSERLVPLVGVALAAMQRHRGGFPRYRDRENDLSATLNKFFRTNGLFPTPGHKIYSFRHSMEDRMKEGGLDEELRRIVMGHSIDRPRYGAGGSLEWRRDELAKIALPFDPAIV